MSLTLNQNLSSFMFFSFDQPKTLSSLSVSFEKLEISKPLDKKKDEYLKTIRGQKRKLHLKNKRLGAVDSLSSQFSSFGLQENNTFGQGILLDDYINDCLRQTFTLGQLSELVSSLGSSDNYKQYFGAIGLRKLLSSENPPIQPVIDTGVLPRLVELLQRDDEEQLQMEISWSFSNLSSGTTEQTKELVDSGVIPVLIKLLGSTYNSDVKLQAVWTLGNIAGDNVEYRNSILQAGAMSHVIRILQEAIFEGNSQMIRQGNPHLIKQGTWVLAILCKQKNIPVYRDIQNAISVLTKILAHGQEDEEILVDALWAISNLSDGDFERIQLVINTEMVPFLVKLMQHGSFNVLNPCIKTIGNLFTGTNEQIDTLLNVPGMMEMLFNSVKHPEQTIRREAVWTLSNITAGTPSHIENIVGNADYLEFLFYIGINDSLEVRREVAFTFYNAIKNANQEQLKVLVENGAVEYLGKLLEEEGDMNIPGIGLRGMKEMLSTGVICWPVLEENNILSTIQKLQSSPNSQIAELAFEIFENFGDSLI